MLKAFNDTLCVDDFVPEDSNKDLRTSKTNILSQPHTAVHLLLLYSSRQNVPRLMVFCKHHWARPHNQEQLFLRPFFKRTGVIQRQHLRVFCSFGEDLPSRNISRSKQSCYRSLKTATFVKPITWRRMYFQCLRSRVAISSKRLEGRWDICRGADLLTRPLLPHPTIWRGALNVLHIFDTLSENKISKILILSSSQLISRWLSTTAIWIRFLETGILIHQRFAVIPTNSP